MPSLREPTRVADSTNHEVLRQTLISAGNPNPEDHESDERDDSATDSDRSLKPLVRQGQAG